MYFLSKILKYMYRNGVAEQGIVFIDVKLQGIMVINRGMIRCACLSYSSLRRVPDIYVMEESGLTL